MKKINVIALSLICVLISACTTAPEPTRGDLIKAQGAEFSRIGEKWNKGETMIADGNAMIKAGKKEVSRGEDLVESGETKIEKGQSMIKKGKTMKTEADQALELRNNG